MLLLVGLGNPGAKHARNRHNIGFMAVDEIVRRHGFGPFRNRFQGVVAEGRIGAEKALALEPLTYMNRSGQSVAAAASFYKIAPEQVFVFHDELDLAPGRLRVKRGGGAAGHNGLRSIDQHLGNGYWRIRLGIGHPGSREKVHGYVLHDFAKSDDEWLVPVLEAIAGEIGTLTAGDDKAFMSRVAQAVSPPPPRKPVRQDDDAPRSTDR